MRYLLDTNVVSELMKPGPNPVVSAWLDEIDEDAVFLSVVTLAELRRGVERLADGRRKRALDEWVTHMIPVRFEGRILDVDARVAEQWARLSVAAQRPLDTDALIAATAVVHDCIIVTRDSGFAVFGVDVLDPWSPS